jgi:GTP diphosphokinase / guanosine-3',5'-bis(diphosphate) 3'-diphosphatase
MDFSEYSKKLKLAYDLVYRKSIHDDGSVQMRFTSPLPNQPYWTHLMNVHNLLISWGVKDYEVLLAAVLHDLVEDSDVTLDYLKKNLSPKTAKLIALVSKPNNYSKEDARIFYGNISKNKNAILIKIADRIDNLLTHKVYLKNKEELKDSILETKKYFKPMAKKVRLEKILKTVILYCEKFTE